MGESENTVPTLQSSSKHATKAFFFNMLKSYGAIPINLILTMLIARLLSPDGWGVFIYSLVLITGSQIILIFTPPSIHNVIYYVYPIYALKNEHQKAKGLIIYSIKIKLFFGMLVTLGYIIFAIILSHLQPNSPYPRLIILLSPMILLNDLNTVFLFFINAVKEYWISAADFFIEKAILFMGYIGLFLISANEDYKLVMLGWTTIFSKIGMFFFIRHVWKKYLSPYKEEKMDKKKIKEVTSYGFNFSLMASFRLSYDQIYSGVLNYYGLPRYNTYNNICNNVVRQTIGAINIPVTPILSDLENSNQVVKMMYLFRKLLKLINLILCFGIGLFFFLIKAYIAVLYPAEYLVAVIFVQIDIFSVISLNLQTYYSNLFIISKNERKMVKIDFIGSALLSIFALMGMNFWGFLGLIISRGVGHAIFGILYWFWGGKLKSEYRIPLIELFIYLIATGVLILISSLFLEISLKITSFSWLSSILLNVLEKVFAGRYDFSLQIGSLIEGVIGAIFFIIFYLIYLVSFRVLTKEDINEFEQLNIKFPFSKRIFNLMRKLLLSRKKKSTI